MTKAQVHDAVWAEREYQDQKWGTHFPNRVWQDWLTILMEEVGEVANEILEEPHGGSEDRIRKELVQVAAVAIAALEFGANTRKVSE